MAGFSPHSGEGAVSTGPMVGVFDARSVAEARTIVELLEAHAIPALVNRELEGILFPWQEPTKNGGAKVLVPATMLAAARDIIRRSGAAGEGRLPFSFGHRAHGRSGGRGRAQPSPHPEGLPERGPGAEPRKAEQGPRFSPEMPRVFELPEPSYDELDEDDETGPIELPLPEPSPLAPRLVIAMLAVALGTLFQRLADLLPAGALESFAARAPVLAEPWRLVTAGFVHMGLEHFFSNAAFGITIGVVLFGTHYVGATVLVWLLASMVGLFMESSLSGAAVLVAGASAGNYGLMGLWARGQLDRARLSPLPLREQLRTVGILLLLVPGAFTPVTSTGTRVAVIAHLGGFVAGLLLGWIFKRRLVPEELSSLRRRSRVALALGLALAAAGFIAGILANLPG